MEAVKCGTRRVAIYLATLCAAAVTASVDASAQTDGLLQLDAREHGLLERLHTLGYLPEAHLSHKPLSVYDAEELIEQLEVSGIDPHLHGTLMDRPIGPFYTNGQDFWAVEGDDYGLQVNPLIYLSLGRSGRWAAIGSDTSDIWLNRYQGPRTTWRNTRGIRASGHIGPHIFLEARIEETQELPAVTALDRITAPRLALVRSYAGGTAYDYQIGTGIVGFRSEHFEVRFGRDRNHWGYGEGSLVLSDYGPVYDQLQIRTTLGRVQYTNLFAGFTDVEPFAHIPSSTLIPRKYGAFHRLSLNLTDRINLNVFESVVFGPDSTTGRGGGFDVAYLNPIILYRTVEADRGSPDNVLLGFGASWIAIDGLQLYGQVLLDEFVVGELFSSDWRNKTGYLAGVHIVPDLSLSIRAELARLRPFLYTHRDPTTAYLHYLDPLGHPAGPNALDLAVFLDWMSVSGWHAVLNFAYTKRGRGTSEGNVGSDLRLSFDTRISDTAPFLAGVRQETFLIEGAAGHELLPKLYIEVGFRSERTQDELIGTFSYVEPLVSLRWGLPSSSLRY